MTQSWQAVVEEMVIICHYYLITGYVANQRNPDFFLHNFITYRLGIGMYQNP